MIKAKSKDRFFLFIFYIMLLCLFPLNVCFTDKEKGPEELYRAAREKLEGGVWSGDPDKAIELFQSITDKFPTSSYAPLAEIGVGDAYFKKKEFLTAIERYEDFRRRRPKFKDIDYVLFKISSSYYNLCPSYDRDITPGESAVYYLELLLKEYPQSSYIKEAEKMLTEMKNRIAKREIYIGDFYWRNSNRQAAKKRYEEALNYAIDDALIRKIKERLSKIDVQEISIPPEKPATTEGEDDNEL